MVSDLSRFLMEQKYKKKKKSNSKSPIRSKRIRSEEETDTYIEKEYDTNNISDNMDELESFQGNDDIDDIDDTESIQENYDIDDTESLQENEVSANLHVNNNEDVKECDSLIIDLIPEFWYLEKVNKLIRNITKTQSIIHGIKNLTKLNKIQSNGDPRKSGACLVKFHNAQICKLAYTEWKSNEMGKCEILYGLDSLMKLYQTLNRTMQQLPVPKIKRIFQNNPQDVNKKETYGLSLQYLNNLKIKLPLCARVYVGNLDHNVDEAKIREVFGLAGRIVHVILIRNTIIAPHKIYAKVEYDHPVEAVQAISMFHNQKLYTTHMMVCIDKKLGIDIPKGLSGIGPGLGSDGDPLKGVRNHVELQPFKKLLKRGATGGRNDGASNAKRTRVSPFVQTDWSMLTPVASNSQYSVQAPMVAQTPTVLAPVQTQVPMPVPAPAQQNMNPFGSQSSVMNPFNMQHAALQKFQMLENLNQQNPANFQQAVNMLLQNTMSASVTGQNSDSGGNASSEWQARPNMSMTNDKAQPNFSAMENYKNSFGYNQNTDNSQINYDSSKYADRDSQETRKSSRDDDKYKKSSDMLLFKNLPRSVTLQALKNKMLEVGELKLAEMTGQGRAIVRFVHIKDAERCIKLFDKSKVDGQIIDVQYF